MQEIGFIGIGLMGHGIARNLLRKGHPLSFLAHRNRAQLADLRAAGAREVGTPEQLASSAEVVILCVTGTPQVEANVYGPKGLLEACRTGQIVIDCSTSQPNATDRIRADFAKKGVRFVDAPLSRTPVQAEEGRLNCMVGADPQTLEEIRPVLEKFCENIFHAGAPGAGHRLKLLNNFLGLGNAAIACEALACCKRLGIDGDTLYRVVSAGGANSANFQMIAPKALKGDLTGLLFTLTNAQKDIGYYLQMAGAASFSGPMGAGLRIALSRANEKGLGDKFFASLIDSY